MPGAIEAQELGHDRGDSLHGCAAVVTDYFGRVWYRTSLAVPQDWLGWVVWLNVGGAYPNAAIWLTGAFIAARHCDLTGFGLDVTGRLRPGQANTRAVSMDTRDEATRARRIDLRLLTWGGLWRSVELEDVSPVAIEDVFVVPDIESGIAAVQAHLANRTGEPQQVEVGVTVRPCGTTAVVGRGTAEVTIESGGEAVVT